MTLDELAFAVASTSPDAVVQGLKHLLLEWKKDPSTVEQLRTRVERYIGNSWIADDLTHAQIYALWSGFCTTTIDGIGGMTMNERLHCFGLFSEFEGAHTKERQGVIYAKLLAKP